MGRYVAHYTFEQLIYKATDAITALLYSRPQPDWAGLLKAKTHDEKSRSEPERPSGERSANSLTSFHQTNARNILRTLDMLQIKIITL